MKNIARFTNSQNAIREKDFIALDSSFSDFKDEFAEKYKLFLETQRGAWEAQATLQRKKNYKGYRFSKSDSAYVFNLIKVYGAAWFGEVGNAYNKNALFSPKGKIYERILNKEHNTFDVDDLFVTFHLYKLAESKENKKRLKSTKFLFYRVIIELLKSIVIAANMQMDKDNVELKNEVLTNSLLKFINNKKAFEILTEYAFDLIDEYLDVSAENNHTTETDFKGSNLNSFIKSPRLGIDNNYATSLNVLIKDTKRFIKKNKKDFEYMKKIILN